MKEYNIVYYNDMGHLMIENYNILPPFVKDFVYEIIKNKILYATDKKGLGCMFYILKPELLTEWTYNINDTKINVNYGKLDKFNAIDMKYI